VAAEVNAVGEAFNALSTILQPQEDAIDTIRDQVDRAAYQVADARAELHKANKNQEQDCVIS
jgi:t-SNARE complex subunit (syntaxin)